MKDRYWSRKRKQTADELFQSPVRTLRPRLNRSGTVTPMETLLVEEELRLHDAEADEEFKEKNRLGYLFLDAFNELEKISCTRTKGSRLAKIVKEMIEHLAGNSEEKQDKITLAVVQKLDPAAANKEKLCKHTADLVIDGSTTVQRILLPLLLSCFPENQARSILLKQNFTSRRKAKVVERKHEVNNGRSRAAEKRGVLPKFVEPVAMKAYTNPLSDRQSNAVHRRNMLQFLLCGKDLPPRRPTTRISEASMKYAIAFVYENSQYRPGKFRNCKVRGSLLKNLPLMLRYSSVQVLYKQYRKSLDGRDSLKIGHQSFGTLVTALTRTGTFNQGLSYYYVDHIDKMKEFNGAVRRLSTIAKNLTGSEADSAATMIERLERQAELASIYLRHELYAKLQEEDPNTYKAVKWALGAKTLVEPIPFATDPLMLALGLCPSIQKVCNKVVRLLPTDAEPLKSEVESMKAMAEVIDKELLHYTKHIVRGWWQEKQEAEMKKKLQQQPSTLFVVLDHKSKTIPRSKFESMTEFFAKNGMSDLGAMIVWYI